MPKVVVTFLCLTLFAICAAAQQAKLVSGMTSELKGLTRIHVAANTDRARSRIIAEIQRSLPQLTITEKAEDAEVWLVFRTETRNFPQSETGVVLGGSSRVANATREYEIVASGEVIRPITRDSQRRLLQFKDAVGSPMTDNLAKEFAAAFVKSYKKAN